MIDTHCHLEQTYYQKDRDTVIARCKEELNAIITSSSNPENFKLTMKIVERYRGFVFASASIHPEYVINISRNEIDDHIELMKKNKANIVAIGETGLDYWWIKNKKLRERQKELTIQFVDLAKYLKLPLIIHARNSKDANAVKDIIMILEQYSVQRVQMHMFNSKQLLQQVLDNGWMISVNTLLLRSKNMKKIIRDSPLEQVMLETDAPWLAVDEYGIIKEPNVKRNEPTAIQLVAKKIGEVKKIGFAEVDRITTKNAIEFFNLKI